MNYPDSKLQSLNRMLKLAAVPARLAILFYLHDTNSNVTGIVAYIKLSQALVSYHLANLETARLVEAEKKGKEVKYSLTETGQLLVSYLIKIGSI